MKTKTVTQELFRLWGDLVFILAGVVATLPAVKAWRFRNDSTGVTASE